jgi:hypothetical protein
MTLPVIELDGRSLHDKAAACLNADMSDRPLSGDLEAARQLLFDDALWMAAEASD